MSPKNKKLRGVPLAHSRGIPASSAGGTRRSSDEGGAEAGKSSWPRNLWDYLKMPIAGAILLILILSGLTLQEDIPGVDLRAQVVATPVRLDPPLAPSPVSPEVKAEYSVRVDGKFDHKFSNIKRLNKYLQKEYQSKGYECTPVKGVRVFNCIKVSETPPILSKRDKEDIAVAKQQDLSKYCVRVDEAKLDTSTCKAAYNAVQITGLHCPDIQEDNFKLDRKTGKRVLDCTSIKAISATGKDNGAGSLLNSPEAKASAKKDANIIVDGAGSLSKSSKAKASAKKSAETGTKDSEKLKTPDNKQVLPTTLIPQVGNLTGASNRCANLVQHFQDGHFELYDLPCYAQYLSEAFIYFAGGIAVLFLVIGGYQYMIGGLSEDKEAGKKTVIYALMGFAITVLAWTLVNVWQVFLTSGEESGSYAVAPPQDSEIFATELDWVKYRNKFSEELIADSGDAGSKFELTKYKALNPPPAKDSIGMELVCVKEKSWVKQKFTFQRNDVTKLKEDKDIKSSHEKAIKLLKKKMTACQEALDKKIDESSVVEPSAPVSPPKSKTVALPKSLPPAKNKPKSKITAPEGKQVVCNPDFLKNVGNLGKNKIKKAQIFLSNAGEKYKKLLIGNPSPNKPDGIDGYWGYRTEKAYKMWRKDNPTECSPKNII